MSETQISHEEAVKIDTQLAQLHTKLSKVSDQMQSAKKSMASISGLKGEWGKGEFRRQLVYPYTLEEVIAAADAKLADENWKTYERKYLEDAKLKLDGLFEERDGLLDEKKPLDETYAKHLWSRFFLLTSSAGGHIHSSMSCSTTRVTSGFAWLPTLSGLTEKDAVDAHGTILCSVCFPTAPVEWTVGLPEEVDPNQCPGSGTYEHTDNRVSGWNNNGRATCNHCSQRVSTTSTGKMRKHKKEATK